MEEEFDGLMSSALCGWIYITAASWSLEFRVYMNHHNYLQTAELDCIPQHWNAPALASHAVSN